MDNFTGKKSSVSVKSQRSFEEGVGLVAALTDLNQRAHEAFFSAKFSGAAANMPRSTPIPIAGVRLSPEDETYTCVISHLPNSSLKKRVYFADHSSAVAVGAAACVVSLFSASPLNFGGDVMTELTDADFLSCCNLCNKQLHGLDIFMYRGEKAFCSADCRDKHIRNENRKEKCRSKAMKPLEYSASPYSGPMQFFAGVAA